MGDAVRGNVAVRRARCGGRALAFVSRRPLLRGFPISKGGPVQWAAEGGARRTGGRGVVCASA
jgi:hypothetical protein